MYAEKIERPQTLAHNVPYHFLTQPLDLVEALLFNV